MDATIYMRPRVYINSVKVYSSKHRTIRIVSTTCKQSKMYDSKNASITIEDREVESYLDRIETDDEKITQITFFHLFNNLGEESIF